MSRRSVSLLLFVLLFIIGCEDDPPEEEKVTLQISEIELLFAPKSNGAPVVATAVEIEGKLEPTRVINLNAGISYDLFVSLEDSTGENLNLEEKGTDYQVFFGFSNGVFSSPTGSGNIVEPEGPVNYLVEDMNGLPLGMITGWITAESDGVGVFRVLVKHLPDGLKTVSSNAEVGLTELDVSWELYIN